MSASRNGYIGRAPGDSSVLIARKTYEPTGVQTDFTFAAGYTPGYCDVYLNGVKLIDATDYTASNGSTVGLTSAAASGDVVEVVAYKAFNLGVPLSNITGNLDITGNISASSSITVDSGFYGDGSNLSGVAGAAITQYISANSLAVLGSPGVSTITRLGATDLNVTGIITANGLSGNVTGAACTFTTGTFNSDVSIGGTLTYEDVTNVDSVGLITARAGVNVSGGEFKVGTALTIGSAGVATFIAPAGVGVTITPATGKIEATTYYGDGSNLSNITSTTINNNADNRLITGSGTANTLNGESTLTFDGVNFGVGSGITMSVTAGIVTARGLDAAISVWTLGASGTDHYTFTGPGNLSATSDPTLNLKRGQKYTFKNRSGGHPFRIQSTPNGSAGTAYNTGVTNNDGGDGTNIIFDVPHNAPNVLYYQCTSHGNMGGAMYISGSGYETKIGTGITFGTAGVTTYSNVGGGVSFRDGVNLYMGNDGGLQIYRQGLNAWIKNTPSGGDLMIQALDSIRLGNASTQADKIRINPTNGSNSIIFYNATGDISHIVNDGGAFDGGLDFRAGITTFSSSTKIIDVKNAEFRVGTGITMSATSGVSTFNANVIMTSADYPNKYAMWDRLDNAFKIGDSTSLKIGESGDLEIYHNGSHSFIDDAGTGNLYIRSGTDNGITLNTDSDVILYYDNSLKFQTTTDGTKTTGIGTFTGGLNTDGLLSEKFNTTAGKLSDNTTIDLEDGMVHYFSTQETTTSTPNIRYSSSKSFNNMVSTGDSVTVTLITTAAAAGYSAQLQIDGNNVTEEWVGGSAPSAGGSDGLDIYSYTILKTGANTYKVIGNVVNATN